MKDVLPMTPKFIDQLAVDIVVCEHRYMQLTAPEKRHAVWGLYNNGVNVLRIAAIMRITDRHVSRLLTKPPPPILDIDGDGNLVDVEGQCVSV